MLTHKRHTLICLHLFLLFAACGGATEREFDVGTWTRYVPLKTNGSEFDHAGTIRVLKETNQTIFGISVQSCQNRDDFMTFAKMSARLYPELKVVACVSSHAPLAEYCEDYLNDNGTDVDWIRTGTVLGNLTRSVNFKGLYIDDFYVIMCRVGRTSYVRHGNTKASPCIKMDEMKNTLREMKIASSNENVQLIPLVYHDNFGYALPGGHAIGAPWGVPFTSPGLVASVAFPLVGVADNGEYALRFFYKSELQGSAPKGSTHAGLVMFNATLGSRDVFRSDASLGTSVQMFEANVTDIVRREKRRCHLSSTPLLLNFSVSPFFAPGRTARHGMYADRTTYVFGIQVVDIRTGTDVVDHDAKSYYRSNASGIVAQSTQSSVVLGAANAMIAQQAQSPSAYVRRNYSHLMSMVARLASDYDATAVYGGHYARLGLDWNNPVSSTQLAEAIEIDRDVALNGSLVWNLALSVSRCRSVTDACDRGIFAESDVSDTRRLSWPTDTLCLPGWFARYVSLTPVMTSATNVSVYDFQKSRGNRSSNIFVAHMFSIRVYALNSNMTFFATRAGWNGSAAKGIASARCPGADDGARCSIVREGRYGELAHLTVDAEGDRLVAELAVTGGCSQVPEYLDLTLPNSLRWTFESGLRDDPPGVPSPPLREIYNRSIEAMQHSVTYGMGRVGFS